ncbi:hypothetical protein G6W61_02505 [Streptomyces sp. KAI-26]|uniref:hypothetical protein n=2 Tax=Streptomyces TaxID=1883 RepID=UPI001587D0A3|nr:hypothetical protein [Streptomyces sp. KAI-26]NUV85105.1 hypothetical protein [Streptomyces sp. KAI-26]NUW19092.1 hypothetical protein [Streptomyces roseoviolaceus]
MGTMADEQGNKKETGKGVFRNCAFEGCGRRFRQREGAGRPRAYCQIACRRRAQYWRDRAPEAGRHPGSGSGVVRPRGAGGRAEKREGLRLLGQALRNLFWFSGLTVREVTHLTCIRPGRLRAILDGEVVPTWPTTFMVVTVMRGQPDDVRWLWEWARGHRPPYPASHDGATDRFQAALRGLRLAAEPGPAARDETDARLVHEERGLPGVLEDWEQARQLIEHFGARAERFRPLWEQARRAALSAPALLPPREDGEGARVE